MFNLDQIIQEEMQDILQEEDKPFQFKSSEVERTEEEGGEGTSTFVSDIETRGHPAFTGQPLNISQELTAKEREDTKEQGGISKSKLKSGTDISTKVGSVGAEEKLYGVPWEFERTKETIDLANKPKKDPFDLSRKAEFAPWHKGAKVKHIVTGEAAIRRAQEKRGVKKASGFRPGIDAGIETKGPFGHKEYGNLPTAAEHIESKLDLIIEEELRIIEEELREPFDLSRKAAAAPWHPQASEKHKATGLKATPRHLRPGAFQARSRSGQEFGSEGSEAYEEFEHRGPGGFDYEGAPVAGNIEPGSVAISGEVRTGFENVVDQSGVRGGEKMISRQQAKTIGSDEDLTKMGDRGVKSEPWKFQTKTWKGKKGGKAFEEESPFTTGLRQGAKAQLRGGHEGFAIGAEGEDVYDAARKKQGMSAAPMAAEHIESKLDLIIQEELQRMLLEDVYEDLLAQADPEKLAAAEKEGAWHRERRGPGVLHRREYPYGPEGKYGDSAPGFPAPSVATALALGDPTSDRPEDVVMHYPGLDTSHAMQDHYAKSRGVNPEKLTPLVRKAISQVGTTRRVKRDQPVSEGKQFGLANRLRAKHDAIEALVIPTTPEPQQEFDDDPVTQVDISSLLDFD